ncbi:MAG: hypothetical protein HYX78_06205 [Armatimonadetes bacterium]|nr:hypothetical protein [Armatimonadota bacterium]
MLPDVKEKGCQGLLGIHWRIRDVEDVASYTYNYAWNPRLTYVGFWNDFAARCFGKQDAWVMSRLMRELEDLGPRWTGGSGQCESGPFGWWSDNYVVFADKGQIDLETGKIRWMTDVNRPLEANLRKLQEIREQLEAIRARNLALGRLQFVVKEPPSLFFLGAGEPITVDAVAMGGVKKPSVILYYRALGDKDFASAKMEWVRGGVYKYTISGEAITLRGLEWCIEARIGGEPGPLVLRAPRSSTYAASVITDSGF